MSATNDLYKKQIGKIMTELHTETDDRQLLYIERTKHVVAQRSREIGHPLSACVVTFGCQMNARDSEKLRGILKAVGYQLTNSEDEADFIAYNTCTVRDNADKHVYGRLGKLVGLKREKPWLIVGLCGCMMQEPQVVEKIKKSYPVVDLIFGTHNLFTFPELLHRVLTDQRRVIDVWESSPEIVENLPVERKYSFKSGVNIMFGCNNFCSYCIVPYVRGREKSREPEAILDECRRLAADGVIEIMLLGQNVNSYGKTLEHPVSFAKLLDEVCQIDGIKRVRFMTSHPKDLSDELIDVIAKNPKICRHFHLPVQSGSDRILKAMNRHYDRARYLDIVRKLREKVPDISLTTDIIVGFPGETEADFEDTLSLVREVGYDSVFTFIYSPRTGTPAAAMPDQVPEKVVHERFDRLLNEVRETAEERCARFQGRTMDVLVEEENKEPGYVTGRISNNITVHFKGSKDLIGKLVPVTLDDCRGFYYFGTRAGCPES